MDPRHTDERDNSDHNQLGGDIASQAGTDEARPAEANTAEDPSTVDPIRAHNQTAELDRATVAECEESSEGSWTRRGMLARSATVGIAAASGFWVYQWTTEAIRKRASVFVARNQRYDASLVQTLHDGLIASGLRPDELRGKRVLLKPNMVEPSRERSHMTTHPLMVHAACDVFRSWGCQVKVGEAPGHVRDTEMALVESNLMDVIEQDRIEFADLNYEEVRFTKNAGKKSPLDGFYFPRSIVEADLVVSMPKMKTHHWVGITVSMKNLYGVLPGIKYGWPKNVLHHAGIPETVADIHASLPKTVAIVDGIVCMEGDGPIMGTPKDMGLVVIGTDLTAVDATCGRIMGIDPTRVGYLHYAAQLGGVIHDRQIEQRGESWAPLVSPFQILDVPHLRPLRPHGVLTS